MLGLRRSIEVACARAAFADGSPGDGLRPRHAVCSNLQLACLLPIAELNRAACRNRRKRIVAGQGESPDGWKRIHLREHRFSLFYLPALQVGVSLIIHRVQALIARLAVCGCCFRFGGQFLGTDIGPNGFVPESQSRKNVRRHVIRVGGGRCDLGIHARCSETFLRERRIVVAMNDVVRDAGVMRLQFEQRLQNLAALLLIGEGLVRFGGGHVER